MMSIRNTFRLALATTWIVLGPALPAFAQEKPQQSDPAAIQQQTKDPLQAGAHSAGSEKSVEAVVGYQMVDDVDERGLARFEEFREVPDGPVVDFARVLFGDFSFTARDAGQDDQEYFLNFWKPGQMSFNGSLRQSLRTYSTGSKTLFSGIGTGNLTIPESFRQGAENIAPAPTSPFPVADLTAYMENALNHATVFDLRAKRKNIDGSLDYSFSPNLTLTLSASNQDRLGTRPLGFGTYIRRQGLSGVPGTGAGNFWRETVETRGVELIEPIDYRTTEFGATLAWAKNGHSASGGMFISRFRNDITTLYFDNPFEATPGRASATTFDPGAEQEPASPNGNNNLRGLFARSNMQLAPNNDYQRVFGTISLKLPMSSRLNATISRGSIEQNDRFLPYAVNPFVVYSGVAGQPGVVYATDAPLPQPSLDGKMETSQIDLKLTSRISRALNVRAGLRMYELDDQRPSIIFPGYSSSGDAFFRAGIGQKDAAGKRILFNEVGGFSRNRANVGAAIRIGRVTLDEEIARTTWDYDARQVEKTTETSYRTTLRIPAGPASINAFYLISDRDYSGTWHVGLETSGVRAYDVWARERDHFGVDVELPINDALTASFGFNSLKDEYPGAVAGFTYGWGLQDSATSTFFANASYTVGDNTYTASAGVDRYQWNSLQVTKTSLTTDYNPTNRWSRESSDRVVWIALEADVPLNDTVTWQTAVDYQRFNGDWETTNLATPDVNGAVAYDYPEISEKTVSLRTSLLWDITSRLGLEVRYLYEPYRLNDFTVDIMSPYMQGRLGETRSNPNDVGPMNVGRFLFLDSRYTDYDANVVSALLHLNF